MTRSKLTACALDSYWTNTMPTIVKLTTKSGGFYEDGVDSAKGIPENPLTYREVREKYHKLVSSVFMPEKANEIEKAIDRLNQMRDIGEFTELLRFD